jgi:pimeloyl-ACP methyl ester carboxylesterase
MSATDARPTIILIHGMWMTPRSWDAWVDHYSDRGYRAIAPGWPGVKDPEETRKDPSVLKGLGVKRMVDHYDAIIGGLDRQPIIIGHSFGGLITQLLLNRGLGAAGVTIGTAPTNGVFVLPPSTLRASFPALKNPLNRNGLAPLSAEQFHWRFANTVSREESDRIYTEHYIPGTNHAFFDVLLSKSAAGVNWSNPKRAPLLLIAGSKDHISPVSLNRNLLKRHRRASAATELKEYPGRPHFMAGLDGWEELADVALNWALEHSGAPQQVGEGVPERPATSPTT